MTRSLAAQILVRAVAILLLLWGVNFVIFDTPLYPSIIEPNSTTGTVETELRNEIKRRTPDRRQILAVGHSRMALLPRVANELTNETGFTFATVGVGGTTPRCWYYELRAVDPSAHRYAAVILPSDDYDEPDEYDYLGDRVIDLNYVAVRLGLRDLPDFLGSFYTPSARLAAARGILFKGFVFRRDFQELLSHPQERLASVRLYREGSAEWIYSYGGADGNLAGLAVDWPDQTIHFPDSTPQNLHDSIRKQLFRQRPPQTGLFTRFNCYWYQRILDHYRGSGTRLIFLQVPRGPVLRPNFRIPKAASAVREMAAQPGVILLDEHLFDELEHPELFWDAMHLNGEGMSRFSRILARETTKVLGPPALR